MGRGRAKAKQTKVARDLKYNSAPTMNLSRLQRDLHSDDPVAQWAGDESSDDGYARYVEDDDEDSAAS